MYIPLVGSFCPIRIGPWRLHVHKHKMKCVPLEMQITYTQFKIFSKTCWHKKTMKVFSIVPSTWQIIFHNLCCKYIVILPLECNIFDKKGSSILVYLYVHSPYTYFSSNEHPRPFRDNNISDYDVPFLTCCMTHAECKIRMFQH